jgi:hypothetical protein
MKIARENKALNIEPDAKEKKEAKSFKEGASKPIGWFSFGR